MPFILKLLDLMALYKMNRFHWHLTEDQVRSTYDVWCVCVCVGGGGWLEKGRWGSWPCINSTCFTGTSLRYQVCVKYNMHPTVQYATAGVCVCGGGGALGWGCVVAA